MFRNFPILSYWSKLEAQNNFENYEDSWNETDHAVVCLYGVLGKKEQIKSVIF